MISSQVGYGRSSLSWAAPDGTLSRKDVLLQVKYHLPSWGRVGESTLPRRNQFNLTKVDKKAALEKALALTGRDPSITFRRSIIGVR